MKRQLIVLLMVIIGIASAYSVCQEFIKPKTKKSYVSEQQDIELDGDMVMCGTQLSGILIELSRAIFLVIKAAITRVNDYACGKKDGCSKVERTERYTKKAKIKEKIDRCIEQLQKMLEDLNVLIIALDE